MNSGSSTGSDYRQPYYRDRNPNHPPLLSFTLHPSSFIMFGQTYAPVRQQVLNALTVAFTSQGQPPEYATHIAIFEGLRPIKLFLTEH